MIQRIKQWWAKERERNRQAARHQTVYHPRDHKAEWFYIGYRQAVREYASDGIDSENVEAHARAVLQHWVETGKFPTIGGPQ